MTPKRFTMTKKEKLNDIFRLIDIIQAKVLGLKHGYLANEEFDKLKDKIKEI